MGNDVTLIPKKPERHSLLTSTEDVVYMPLGSKDSHGILQVGDNLVVDKGIVSLDLNGDWYQKVLEALELSKSEILILDADGVQTSSGVEFTIKNYDEFEKYKTDKRRFLIKMKLPVLNNIDKDNRVYIHFGSKRYIVFSFVKGMNSQLTLKDLQAVVRKDTDGYSYFANFIYLDSSEFNGFVLDPAASAGTITGLKPDGVTIGINKEGDLNAIALDDGFINIADELNFDDFKGFVHLTHDQFERIKTYGEIEIDGKVLKYDDSLVYITPDVVTPSNPNLLINGDFRVNQRGQPSYVAQGWKDTYSVDRWALRGSTGTITLDVATKTLTGAGWLVQEIEDYKSLIGKTLTLSMPIIQKSSKGGSHLSLRVYYTDGTYTNLFDINYGTYSGFMSHTFVFNVDETKTIRNVITLYYQGADAITQLDYVKLEVGSVATAFSPRPYAEELMMCQRYYQILSVNNSGFSAYGKETINDVEYHVVNTPVPLTSILMRTNPTVTVTKNPYIRNYNNLNKVSQLHKIQNVQNNLIMLQFYADGVEPGVVYHMFDGIVTLDAEIIY